MESFKVWITHSSIKHYQKFVKCYDKRIWQGRYIKKRIWDILELRGIVKIIHINWTTYFWRITTTGKAACGKKIVTIGFSFYINQHYCLERKVHIKFTKWNNQSMSRTKRNIKHMSCFQFFKNLKKLKYILSSIVSSQKSSKLIHKKQSKFMKIILLDNPHTFSNEKLVVLQHNTV